MGNGSGAIIRRGVVAVTHADAFVGDHGHGSGGEVVGEVVEVFEGEVELLPGRLGVDVELNQLHSSVGRQLCDYGEAGDDIARRDENSGLRPTRYQ